MGMMRQFARTLREGAAPIVDLIYPPRCPACGEAIGEHGGLCAECWSQLVIPGDPACALCQRPLGQNALQDGAICVPCMKQPPLHDGIAAGTLYNDTSRKLVLAFKHGRRIALASLLARLIIARLPRSDVAPIIVPVPLHRTRLWQRGFNQSALLGRELARAGCGELRVDALVRSKATPSLGGKSAKARAHLLKGVIKVKNRSVIENRHVLLVDDVLTSGATSTACIKALKKAGARSVTIACFARVLDEAIPAAKRS